MKKLIILLLIAILGYFAYSKFGDVAGSFSEKKIAQFITDNQNKPIAIEQLEKYSYIESATWEITDFQNNSDVDSVFRLKILGQEQAIPVHMHSKIEYGKTKYEGKSFGLGKVTTQFDLSKIANFPSNIIPNDAFSMVNYLTLNGQTTAVSTIKPISHQSIGESGKPITVNFAGATGVTNYASFLNPYENINGVTKINGFSVNEAGKLFALSQINVEYQLTNAKNVSLNITPFNANFDTDDGKMDANFKDINITSSSTKIAGQELPFSTINLVVDGIETKVNGHPSLLVNKTIFSNNYSDGENNTFNYLNKFSSDIDPDSFRRMAATRNIPVAPTKINLEYSAHDIPVELINVMMDLRGKILNASPNDKLSSEVIKNDLQAFLGKLLNSGARFKQHLVVSTTAGNGYSDFSIQINDTFKNRIDNLLNLLANKPSARDLAELFDASFTAEVDESLANAFRLTELIEMTTGAKAENDKIKIYAQVKNGQLNINDRGIPLP